MMKKEICSFCGGVIFLDKDRFVLLGTYETKKISEENYYHIKCWKKFWDSKIQEQIMVRAKAGMQGIVKVMNQIGNR